MSGGLDGIDQETGGKTGFAAVYDDYAHHPVEIVHAAGDAGKVLKASDFPFKSAKQVADVIVERAGL